MSGSDGAPVAERRAGSVGDTSAPGTDIACIQDEGHVRDYAVATRRASTRDDDESAVHGAYDDAMRRVLLLGALALLAAGCTDARQGAAARAVETHAGGTARCTRSARMLGGSPVETTVFVCNVKRGSGLCDRYRSTMAKHGFDVTLEARRVDCVLPSS